MYCDIAISGGQEKLAIKSERIALKLFDQYFSGKEKIARSEYETGAELFLEESGIIS